LASGSPSSFFIGWNPCEWHLHQLREAMALQLKPELNERGVCFELGIQLQTDKREMPVEDPTVEWKTPSGM
jgi:hypothetical protein